MNYVSLNEASRAFSRDYTRTQTIKPEDYQSMFLSRGAWHWDIDGTCVENEAVHVAAWSDIAREHGVTLTDAMFDDTHEIYLPDNSERGARKSVQPLRGASPQAIACWILGKADADIGAGHVDMRTKERAIQEISGRHLGFFLKNTDLLKPREGIETILDYLQENNWISGAVTGSVREIFKANMSVLGAIGRRWDYIVTAEEVDPRNKKPDPYPYELGLTRLGAIMGMESVDDSVRAALKRRSCVIEDGTSGVYSAANAELPCIQYILPSQKPFDAKAFGREAGVVVVYTADNLKEEMKRAVRSFSPRGLSLTL
ncbi:MAG: HAD family phosphatase [Alphaproteobacteria bacterium]|nr:HAD family phosphatase [Alphaproteobacteria bacterium]